MPETSSLEVIAHDIKTPLHILSGMLELLAQSPTLVSMDRQFVTSALNSTRALAPWFKTSCRCANWRRQGI